MSIEKNIKQDFNCAFKQDHWKLFKQGADCYLKHAALLKKKHISKYEIILENINKDGRLLFRNKQKRLFIGIACELLVKAYYLKSGFHINKILDKGNKGKNAFLFNEIEIHQTNNEETITLNNLIQGLSELERKKLKKRKVKINSDIKTALEIGRIYRNKEAHIITKGHKYNSSDYDKIEKGITSIYKKWFIQKLKFQISFESDEKGIFKIE